MVSKEEVGVDSEAAALLSSRTVNGEVVAVEYLEGCCWHAGCCKCEAKTPRDSPQLLGMSEMWGDDEATIRPAQGGSTNHASERSRWRGVDRDTV